MRGRCLTITTDVGAAYAAQMKAVLLARAPHARLVELALELRPHGVAEAAFLLDQMAHRFPAGSVHLAVVDPGVGGRRAPLAVATRDGSRLVGPDNGLLDRLALRLGVAAAVRLDRARLGPPERVGTTFDGRDLFAPAAAALAEGTPLGRLGPAHDYRPKPSPAPRRSPDGARGRLVHVDRFGNAITDLPSDWLPPDLPRLRVRVGAGRWSGARVVRSYEELPRRALGLLGSSFGSLELARREAPFARDPANAVGRPVAIAWGPSRRRHRARK